MGVGASAAAYWVATGGSYLAALAVYSAVSVAVILATAALAHGLAGRGDGEAGDAASGVPQPAFAGAGGQASAG